MGMVDDILDRLAKDIDRKLEKIKPLREFVASGSNGLIQTYRFGETIDPDKEAYPRLLTGVHIATDQEVITLVVGKRRIVLGPVQAAALSSLTFDVPIVGQGYNYGSSASAAENTSTANTTKPTAVTALTLTIADLPAGNYKLVVRGSHLTAHSAGSSIATFVAAAGNEGTAYTISTVTGASTTAATNRIEVVHTFSSIAISGSFDVLLRYYAGAAGTVYSRNPALVIAATRL